MINLLMALATFYVVTVAAIYLLQDSLIYPAPREPGREVPGFERISYRTTDGLELRAGYRAAEPGMPTVLYFHGNGADWQSSVVATDRLVPLGYGVLAAEYRGYRGNPGAPGEKGLYDDGRAAIAWLKSQGVGGGEIVLIGNSIGSGVATQMAVGNQFRALVLISPFVSLSQIVSEKIRWAPTSLLLRDRFANIEKIGRIEAPLLLLHGDADTLIPAHHSEALARANPAAELRIFPGAGHELAWREEAESATVRFLGALPPLPQHPRNPAPDSGGDIGELDMHPGDRQPQD